MRRYRFTDASTPKKRPTRDGAPDVAGELVGSYPPGNYHSVGTPEGYFVYRLDASKVDPGTVYNGLGKSSEGATQAAQTGDTIKRMNDRNRSFWGRK